MTLSGNSLRQTVHTHSASVHQAAKLVAVLLRVVGVTAGLAESNGSIPPGLWLMSPAGWLPRTGISSGTLRSVIEYGLPLPFFLRVSLCQLVPSWVFIHLCRKRNLWDWWNVFILAKCPLCHPAFSLKSSTETHQVCVEPRTSAVNTILPAAAARAPAAVSRYLLPAPTLQPCSKRQV